MYKMPIARYLMLTLQYMAGWESYIASLGDGSPLDLDRKLFLIVSPSLPGVTIFFILVRSVYPLLFISISIPVSYTHLTLPTKA